SVVDYLAERSVGTAHRGRDVGGAQAAAMPRNIALPWMLNSKTDFLVNAGPFAAFLGQAHDPIWTDFTAPGTRTVPRYGDGQTREFFDPFGGTLPSGRFVLSSAGRLRDDIPVERLNLRQALLEQFERGRRQLDAGGDLLDRHRQRAYSMLTSNVI